jgi:hypothetical protein
MDNFPVPKIAFPVFSQKIPYSSESRRKCPNSRRISAILDTATGQSLYFQKNVPPFRVLAER